MFNPKTIGAYAGFGTCYPNSCSQEEIQEILFILYAINLRLPFFPAVIGCSEKERPEMRTDQIAMM